MKRNLGIFAFCGLQRRHLAWLYWDNSLRFNHVWGGGGGLVCPSQTRSGDRIPLLASPGGRMVDNCVCVCVSLLWVCLSEVDSEFSPVYHPLTTTEYHPCTGSSLLIFLRALYSAYCLKSSHAEQEHLYATSIVLGGFRWRFWKEATNALKTSPQPLSESLHIGYWNPSPSAGLFPRREHPPDFHECRLD